MERDTSRPSIVWSLFKKKDNCLATCSACHNDYSFKTSISNLRKHWMQKHRDVDISDCVRERRLKNTQQRRDSSLENSQEHRDSIIDTSDGELDNSILKNKSNPTWRYYEVLDSDKFEATCKLCGENIPYETVSDLAKHVRSHGEQTKDTDDEDDDEVEELPSQEIKKDKRNSKMWQYFTIIDKVTKIAACNYCKRILCYGGTVTNLKRHLLRKHPEVIEMVMSSNGDVYEVETEQQLDEDDEKDPIEMDTVYLEDLEESMDQIQEQQITMKSSKKKERQSIVRHFAEISKEQVKSNNKYSDEPLPKKSKPDTKGTIDYFGQYVVSLLKELPKPAAEQLQNEIILQIFTKKASLEQQTSNNYAITVSGDHNRYSNEIITEPVTVTISEQKHESTDNNTEVTVPETLDK